MTTPAQFHHDAAPDTAVPALPGDGGMWVRPVLTRLAMALGRRRAYGPAHPMVVEAETALADELTTLVHTGRSIALGVAYRELLVDGAPLTSAGALGRDLAERLYRRGIGAVTIQRGVTADGVRTMLGWIAQEGDADREEPPPEVVGFSVGRVAYDRLALSDDETVKAEVDALWRALAEVAFDNDRSWQQQHRKLEDATPEEVADSIRRHLRRRGYAERVGFVLGNMAGQVGRAVPAVRDEVGARLQGLMRRLGGQSIATVLHAVGNGREQRHFIKNMADALPVKAVVEWMEMAALASDQELSHHLLRILSKLSVHGGNRRGRPGAPDVFLDFTRDLVDGWELGDPNPEEHLALLDQIAMIGAAVPRALPAGSATMGEASLVGSDAEAARLVQMACEIDEAGADALAAVEALVAARHTQRVLAWLAVAPGPAAATALRAHLLSPAAIMGILLCDPLDTTAARLVLDEVDSSSAPTLLDALQAASSRVARRMIYERLRTEGTALFPELRRRLNGAPPWYFVRNLLALMRDIGVRLGGADGGLWISDVAAFQSHPREQVRMEALRMLVHDLRSREAAICRALDDDSPRIVTAAVDAAVAMVQGTTGPHEPHATGEVPSRVVLTRDIATRLMRVVDRADDDALVQVRAIRALAAANGPTVRSWLLQRVTKRSRLLRRLKLARPSQAGFTAVDILRAQYADHPEVRRVLTLVEEQWAPRRARGGGRPVPRPAGNSTWE